MDKTGPDSDLRAEHESLLQFLYICPHGMAQFDRQGTISLLNPAFARLAMPLLTEGKTLSNLIEVFEPFLPDLRSLLHSPVSHGMLCDGTRVPLGHAAPGQDARVLSLTIVRMDADEHMAVVSDLTEQVAQERRLKENQAWRDSGINYVNHYRREVAYLGIGMACLGLAAQLAAGYLGAAPLSHVISINAISASCLLLLAVLARKKNTGVMLSNATAGTLIIIAVGLLYLDGGYRGSHFYPELWIFSLAGIVGMFGARLLTISTVFVGVGMVISGKLFWADLLFGPGGDQSWGRVAVTSLWWSAALLATTFSGSRVIEIARAAIQARQALQHAQAVEHAHAAQAEQQRSVIATARAKSLKDLAETFDGQVRTTVTTVARTADQIRARATTLASAAAKTGHGAADAASVAAATSADTTIVAQASTQLRDSLELVCKQTRAAAEATERMSNQVGHSHVALAALDVVADQVGSAVALIRDIAARTKLLALKARIEAAKAGPTGLGFAVVAEEVKQLAKQTADTTDEVEKLMGSMRDAHNGVAVALSSITQNIEQVIAFAGQVDDAIEGQAKAVGSIVQTAAALHEKARNMSAEVSDVAGSAETTSTAALEMLHAADALAKDAHSLQCEAGAFIVNVHAA